MIRDYLSDLWFRLVDAYYGVLLFIKTRGRGFSKEEIWAMMQFVYPQCPRYVFEQDWEENMRRQAEGLPLIVPDERYGPRNPDAPPDHV